MCAITVSLIHYRELRFSFLFITVPSFFIPVNLYKLVAKISLKNGTNFLVVYENSMTMRYWVAAIAVMVDVILKQKQANKRHTYVTITGIIVHLILLYLYITSTYYTVPKVYLVAVKIFKTPNIFCTGPTCGNEKVPLTTIVFVVNTALKVNTVLVYQM
ncbi:hypothetical protein BDC45DRAFT_594295 [Circinella umbellata]|nr:hypothetical protein BDC45DRAFT_594295 [Circinella umbellata]